MNNIGIKELAGDYVTISWKDIKEASGYKVYWADHNTETMEFKCVAEVNGTEFTLHKATHVPHYFKVAAVVGGIEKECSNVLKTKIKKKFEEQLEKLSRALVVVKAKTGIFLSWRFMLDEVKGYSKTGLTGTNFHIYKNGKKIAVVSDSSNYIDVEGTVEDLYCIAPVWESLEGEKSKEAKAWSSEDNYIDIPMQIPAPDVNPRGETFTYSVNDMSVGDIDGDGEYEYFIKWDPSNSKDVSQKGYTGKCFIDCYKLDGTLLWRLDMGWNIRAGAHYTQFMVYDFNNDGKAEMAVKTAPGTKITRYNIDGTVKFEAYITIPKEDLEVGYSHKDDYRLSAEGYFDRLVGVFMDWSNHEMVKNGTWPKTLEECFGIDPNYTYPLNKEDATELVTYFMDVFVASRSSKNNLRDFDGFILDGPEYLTMFSGEGEEIETIPFKFGRVDDGLLWADYALPRIEPGNRVDRFLSGVAYLDGERPYLIVCRGYYTRATIVAYSFFDNKFKEYWSVDSGWVLMDNPFNAGAHDDKGCDPIYGILAGQGNHSLSTADVDGDGYQEIIYGAAVIDHDGSLLYSSYGYLPDGKTYRKFGHGDAMHVANINPDKPGLEIFNVFEGASSVPYGYALRDAETGEVIYGEPADSDLGRCMIGDINPNVRGLQTWVTKVRDVNGNVLDDKMLGSNQSIRWAADLSTQILDGANIFHGHSGVINDNTHGVMLVPEGMSTNNGTKGNPCLVADIFGDWREELILRKSDNSAIRIYTNIELTNHKLFTLMHDIQYRTAVAWQNNCYNQPGYTKFYLASDMDFSQVLPELE
ncbi:MAG: rhamnogalacturonan lyase [Clostridiales bacterium]|nr:rhamnogalacturonan lyase [Clostridiales bacterium]